ncbi:MAG TPA: zf-HC2 domain-containing protein [Thermoanaerobaculia bacterium]|jgi:anti-sigma factor RsiW
MNRPEHDPFCEEALDLLEPYVDGDLPAIAAARLREHLERCATCAAELNLAAKIQRELRSLPQLDCPPEVLEKVQRTGRGEVVPFVPRPRIGLRIAAAAAMLALALGGGVLFLHVQQQEERPSPQEIAQATAEARYALAYIGKVTRRTRTNLREDVLEKRLVAPASRTVSQALGETPSLAVPSSATPRRSDKEF